MPKELEAGHAVVDDGTLRMAADDRDVEYSVLTARTGRPSTAGGGKRWETSVGSASPRADRSLSVDALKCMAMVMVVLTHVLNLRSEFAGVAPGLVRSMVAFNMPLFTFLSGWVLFGREGSDLPGFLRRKALGLIVPYVAWISIELPLRDVPPAGWLPRIGQALIDPHAGMQMWFLWVLFWLFALFAAVRLVSRAELLLGSVAVASLAVSSTVGPAFGLDKITWLFPFLVLGYLASSRRASWRRLDPVLAVAGTGGFLALTALGGEGLPYAFAGAVAGIASVSGLYRLAPAGVLRPQAWIGRRTLGLYGWQMVLLPFLVIGSGSMGALVTLAVVVAASSALTLVLEWTPVTAALFLGTWRGRHAVRRPQI